MIEAITSCVGYSRLLNITLPNNLNYIDKVVVVTSPDDHATIEVCNKYERVICVITDSFFRDQNGAINPRFKFNKGAGLNQGIHKLEYNDWILNIDVDILIRKSFYSDFYHISKISDYKSIVYTYPRIHVVNHTQIDGMLSHRLYGMRPIQVNIANNEGHNVAIGYFQLFHRSLPHPRRQYYREDITNAGKIDTDFSKALINYKKRDDHTYLMGNGVIHIKNCGTWDQVNDNAIDAFFTDPLSEPG